MKVVTYVAQESGHHDLTRRLKAQKTEWQENNKIMWQPLARVLGHKACHDHSTSDKAESCLEDAGRYHSASLERSKKARGAREAVAAETK